MPISSRSAANHLIGLARTDGRYLSPLQIIKLVYIAHGWMLGMYQRPLVDDRIEAWRYGPVVPDLYHSMKQYGGGFVVSDLPDHAEIQDPLEKDMVEQVYKMYGSMTGIQLSALTHQQDTPWSNTWNAGGQNTQISNDLIAEHYRRLADERAKKSQ